jgi:hypothetical protein
MGTQQIAVTLERVSCAECHIVFGIEVAHVAALRESHRTFYCPKGHRLHFGGESESERLERELAAAKRREGFANDRARATRDQLEASERSLRGHKAAKTRIKNRIANGVCPCCKRSFQDLHRHMAGQHPHFGSEQ